MVHLDTSILPWYIQTHNNTFRHTMVHLETGIFRHGGTYRHAALHLNTPYYIQIHNGMLRDTMVHLPTMVHSDT